MADRNPVPCRLYDSASILLSERTAELNAANTFLLKPAGFLCDDGAECRYIRMEGDPLDNLIDKASEFLSGIRGDA